MSGKKRALALALLMTLSSGVDAKRKAAPYNVEVWSDVLFDESGQAVHADIANRAKYPEAFVEQVMKRLATASIEPVTANGAPATFKTGVGMHFEVTPGANGGQVRVTGMEINPRPVKRAWASFPTDIARVSDWSGAVIATCRVGTTGRSTTADVHALPGIPESARRWAVETCKLWQFVPPEVNGVATESTYRWKVSLETEAPAFEDFRHDKFERLMRSK